jgi:hypothetical protein
MPKLVVDDLFGILSSAKVAFEFLRKLAVHALHVAEAI